VFRGGKYSSKTAICQHTVMLPQGNGMVHNLLSGWNQ
jgi:hypothetical protein